MHGDAFLIRFRNLQKSKIQVYLSAQNTGFSEVSIPRGMSSVMLEDFPLQVIPSQASGPGLAFASFFRFFTPELLCCLEHGSQVETDTINCSIDILLESSKVTNKAMVWLTVSINYMTQ